MADSIKGILWLVPTTGQETLPAGRYSPAAHFHVTLQFSVAESDWVQYIGKVADVVLESVAWNGDIEAIKVSILDTEIAAICSNPIPHLTLSHREGIKPFLSNKMLEGDHQQAILTNRETGTFHSIPMRVEFHRWG